MGGGEGGVGWSIIKFESRKLRGGEEINFKISYFM